MSDQAKFTVDTKLFRELGELLVGRESTALVELIKNAYDADATHVRIVGKHLDDREKGVIIVEDDGVGMNADEFALGFLRIAGRTRVAKDRRSRWFRRRYTGEKGVGRLAAHKLARVLVVESQRWNGEPRDDLRGFKADDGVLATIKWDAVEALETLEDVAGSGAVEVTAHAPANSPWPRAGTRLRLSRLRRAWKQRDIDRFHSEVATLVPPPALTQKLPAATVAKKVLFDTPRVRDQGTDAEDFTVEYSGELSMGDRALATKTESADWVIEVRSDGNTVALAVSPTARFKKESPLAEAFRASRPVAEEAAGLQYDVRIFERHQQPWDKALQGVRVYFEGFRVLPYGDPGDDWLDLNRDAKARTQGRLSSLKPLTDYGLVLGDEHEGLAVKGASLYFGAVFLTREHSPGLRLLINREGFLPGPAFDDLQKNVRVAIDVCTRLRNLATLPQKEERRKNPARQRRASEESSLRETPSSFLATEVTNKIRETVADAMKVVELSRDVGVKEKLRAVSDQLDEAARLVQDATAEAAMYRVLASLGLEQGAFLHEVNTLAVSADLIVKALEDAAGDVEDKKLRSKLRHAATEATELRERLRRNAAYITDVTGLGGRKRRSRQPLAQRFETVRAFFDNAASRRGVKIEGRIPEDVKTPAMFPAEITALFSNLLSNAVKFAGKDGRVLATAAQDGSELVIRIENTGDRVDLPTSDKWFQPFQSTTTEVDAALGQGMGLGLTITRSLLDEYGGSIRFVRPHLPYVTAVEARIPST